MDDEELKETIREQMEGLNSPREFAKMINELGFELMDSGQLDSDELVWEVAREFWGDDGDTYEQDVYDEFEKLI